MREADAAAAAVTAAAADVLRAATDPAELTYFRRDFDRVARLAKANGWTDDTPVPEDAFGPLWPPGRVPTWARK